MPSEHRLRLDDHHRPETAGPEAEKQDPEASVHGGQADSGSLAALKNLQLMTEGEDFQLERGAVSEARKDSVEEASEDCTHTLNAKVARLETPGILGRTEFMGGTGARHRRRYRRPT